MTKLVQQARMGGRRAQRLYASLPFALALMLAPLAACSDALPAEEESSSEAGIHVEPSATAEAGTTPTSDSGSRARASEAGLEDAGSASATRDAGQSNGPSTRDAGRSPDGGDGGAADGGDSGARNPRDAGAPLPVGDAGRPPARSKFVGNITTRGQVRADFVTYWDQLTPENEGKWGSVEATRNQMNWAGLDRAYAYAKEHGIKFKQHTFVWGSQQPNWLGGLSAAQQKAEVEEWIRLFCERYPDVEMIDVVNEPPPHTTPVYMAALGGAGESGYDWIVQSFKWARQYCPKATLILNDYNNIEYGADNTRFIAIANAVKAAGAPIDAVGAQAHDAHKLSTSSVQQMLDKLASATGLPVYISEYDIDLADDAQQEQVMRSQFTMFWNNANVRGITIWGYVVGATWQPNTGLMTAAGVKRPALTWLETFLSR
jgi:endo-1,4-beta-xylanase